MTLPDRARKAAFLCCHFERNFAYYSTFRRSRLLREEGFWLTVHGNFVDVCVLEWCKLFGNRNGKYHWQNIFSSPAQFRQELLTLHSIDDARLEMLWNEVKDYRDDFVAHLEDRESTPLPNMNIHHLLIEFYYRKLQATFPQLRYDDALPTDMDRYYRDCLTEAKQVLALAEDATAQPA